MRAQDGELDPSLRRLGTGTGARSVQEGSFDVIDPSVLAADRRDELAVTAVDAAPRTAVTGRPKMVLVLDTSGSMSAKMADGDTSRAEALRAGVEVLLRNDGAVDFGLVLFDHRIREVVPIARANRRSIMAALGRASPGSGTCYDALATADELLRREPDTGRYVLFATDGVANRGGSDGSREAAALRAAGATIFTVSLGAGGPFLDHIRSLAGHTGPKTPAAYTFEPKTSFESRQIFASVIVGTPAAPL
jgi:Mg-chelatase subunit ChlD